MGRLENYLRRIYRTIIRKKVDSGKPAGWTQEANQILNKISREAGRIPEYSSGFANKMALEKGFIFWEPSEDENAWFEGWYRPTELGMKFLVG